MTASLRFVPGCVWSGEVAAVAAVVAAAVDHPELMIAANSPSRQEIATNICVQSIEKSVVVGQASRRQVSVRAEAGDRWG